MPHDLQGKDLFVEEVEARILIAAHPFCRLGSTAKAVLGEHGSRVEEASMICDVAFAKRLHALLNESPLRRLVMQHST